MSVRFNRQGTGVVNDHNDLANKGTHTHAEIDQYLTELDEARGLNPSLDARFDLIEQKNADQDTKDTAQDETLTDHGTRLTTAEGTITDHESRLDAAEPDLAAVKSEVETARGTYPTLKERIEAGSVDPALQGQVNDIEAEVEAARGTYPTLNDRISALPTTGGGNPQEVIDARTGVDGTTYPTLDARLDALESRAPSGGGGGVSGVVKVIDEIDYPPDVRTAVQREFTTPPYVIGSKTLEVYEEGVLMQRGADYNETTATSITFTRDIPVDLRITARVNSVDGTIRSDFNTLQGEVIAARKTYASLDERISQSAGGMEWGTF